MKKKIIQWVCAFCAVALVITTSGLPVRAISFDPGFVPQSKSLELVNLDTGDTIYAKNTTQKLYQASTTKLMTFIVASELIKDPKDTTITINDNVQNKLPDRSYVSVQLAVGERISALNLMYCMLLPSGNDAAIALAEAAAGGNMQQFIQLMNKKAKELGCTCTNYTNVFGVADKNHYTTAEDLKKVYRCAYSLPYFKEITSKSAYTVPATNYTPARKLAASNKLMDKASKYYYQPCTSGKTGTSDEAGYCLASTASKNGMNYLCIALDAPSQKSGRPVPDNGAFEDSRQLYEWAFSSLKKQAVLSKDKAVANVSVLQAKDRHQQLAAVPVSDYNAMLPDNGGKITTKAELPKNVTAPVKKGAKIGSVKVLYNNETLTTMQLVAAEDIPQYVIFYKQRWFKIALVAVIAAAAGFLIVQLIRFLRNHHRRGGSSFGSKHSRNRYSGHSRHHASKGSYHNYH
ncbi:MAG: hypothetical protein LKF71_04180 [Oscillospiraceae bacterium]|jgi:D-alanyl-D-alanine carboxypeptidase (penicillin-binding protein 5/6)|nr:hypothetical protein [Oscillospiraceae bacterium]